MNARHTFVPWLGAALALCMWLPAAARADRILMTGCFAGASTGAMITGANAALGGTHTVTAVDFSAALPATITTANYDRVYLNAAGGGCSAAFFTAVQNFVLAGGDLYIAVEFDVGFGGYTETAALLNATTTIAGVTPVARPTGGAASGQNNEPSNWVTGAPGTCPSGIASSLPTGAAGHFTGAPMGNFAVIRSLSSQALAVYFDERTLRPGAGRVFAIADTSATVPVAAWQNADAFLSGAAGFGTGICEPVCGNGVFDGAEQCDDGNSVPGDGCTSACRVEAGYVCRGARSVCAITCGDGVRASSEACDDGNRDEGDGCSRTCTTESGWSCSNPGTSVFVSRRGLTDCRESAAIATTPFTASDAVPAIGAGRWRARYVGGIVEYSAGALFTAGYISMTQSDGPPVLLNGGCLSIGSGCVNGPRTSAAAELAFMLSTPRAEIYDFTSINATTSVALWDNGCFNNSDTSITYRFDTVSECVPNDFCQYEFRAPASASYFAGSDFIAGRAPSVLFDGANLLPAPVRPNSVYRGTGLTDTLAPRVGSIVRFNFAGPRTLSNFYLWQNYNPDTEGLTQFGLTFRAADGAAIGAERTFTTDDCDCTRVPSERFTFPAVAGVTSVDLRIIATENGSFAHLMEVLFGSAPICNDGNVCTTDSCRAGACSAVGVPAGTTGLCADGDACSGDPTNLCVGCATIGNCSGETPYCNMMTNECVGCITSADCNDDNACTSDVCTASTCSNTSLAAGASCAGGVCNGAPILPMCVSCLTAADCADTNPCTTEACVANNCALFAVEPGTPGMCSGANVCSGPMGTPVNTCVECVTDAQCSGATPLCNTASNACVACMGDFGADGLACPMEAPLCTTGGACIRCTSNADCAGNASGPLCDLMTGSCGTACNGDTDCTGDAWCTASRVCSPTVPNGMPVPEVGPANGMCTPSIGMRVCVSEVCFEADDLCGLPNGEPCTGVSVCRSAICAPSGLCAECDTADDCDGGRVCNVPTGTCVMTDAGVMNDGGLLADAGMLIDVGSRTDTGRSDAGEVDGGILGIDAGGRVDAGDTVGGLAGGACGCAVNTEKSARGLALMLGVLAMLVVRRRRAR